MQNIDERIKALDGVSYYARYVDDIIVIFTPKSNEAEREYRDEVESIVNFRGLTLNASKTKEVNLLAGIASGNIEYLGYQLTFGSGTVQTKLTQKKINRYKERIDLAINAYTHLSKVDEKKARKELVKRVRFLTGNTRLSNNKKNILVGIYYSNSQLTSIGCLRGLDCYLQHKVTSEIHSPSLQSRLSQHSFLNGFETKRFSPFKPQDLSDIMKVWSSRG